MATDYVEIPPSVLEKNKHVNLSIDIMYVNRIPFVTTISCNIKFTTVKAIQNRTKSQLVKSIKNVLPIYTQRGLQVENALLYGEFVPLRTDLLPWVSIPILLLVTSMCPKSSDNIAS